MKFDTHQLKVTKNVWFANATVPAMILAAYAFPLLCAAPNFWVGQMKFLKWFTNVVASDGPLLVAPVWVFVYDGTWLCSSEWQHDAHDDDDVQTWAHTCTSHSPTHMLRAFTTIFTVHLTDCSFAYEMEWKMHFRTEGKPTHCRTSGSLWFCKKKTKNFSFENRQKNTQTRVDLNEIVSKDTWAKRTKPRIVTACDAAQRTTTTTSTSFFGFRSARLRHSICLCQ